MIDYFVYAGMAMVVLTMVGTLALMLKSKDQLTIAVISDMIFYSMIAFYILWSILNTTQIAYEIIMLAAIVGGVLPTMSLARIISKGRR